MKVLIVKISALGDVVHALPVLAYLKSADPAVEIDWLVEKSFAPLLEGHPLIHRVHTLEMKARRRQGWTKAVSAVLAVIKELRREKYDLVLDLQGNSKSGLFTLLSGAPLRVGFDRDGVREWPNLLASNRRVPLTAADHHVGARALALARAGLPGGRETLLAGPLPVDPAALARVETLLAEQSLTAGPLVVLHYGTTWKTKLWPLESWKQLAAALVEKGVRPILTWGNDEEHAAAREIFAASGERAVIWPRGSLKELIALLSRVDLVVGADTGPVHIAAAVGTPTVSIYRVTDAQRNGPRGERHIRLQVDLPCSPCLKKACERDSECGGRITVEQVLVAMANLCPLSAFEL
ncbi:MAG: lipopolysaccharide heptosyltransferase I [Trichloromonas sp.]|jgi:heptosyltransferase-1|nr:lipopolysaccharide heptosyltransferase I [Trichloromonas sp.]